LAKPGSVFELKARKCIEGSNRLNFAEKIIFMQKIIMINPSIQRATRVTQGERVVSLRINAIVFSQCQDQTQELIMMKYKGYEGKTDYDDDAKIFHGEVIGLKDVITFQGTTAQELEKAFKDSIDDYLAWCKLNRST
jgi:hypothetical protein